MNYSRQKFLIVIEGPTAVGKTGVSIRVASHFNTEIISSDSRQFYKGIEIGSAAPEPDELKAVKHHFVSHLDLEQDYSAGQFESDCIDLIEKRFEELDVLVLVGGSGLYVKAVLEGFADFPDIPTQIREKYRARYDAEGLQPLLSLLEKEDPEYYSNVDRANSRRILRALEVIETTGKPFSAFRSAPAQNRPFSPIRVALEIPRDQLYGRIDQRVDSMMSSGLLEEAKSLFSKRHLNSLQTLGYRELFDHLEGHMSLDEAVSKIKQHSRNYAKRQMTWLRKQTEIRFFSPLDIEGLIEYLRGEITSAKNSDPEKPS